MSRGWRRRDFVKLALGSMAGAAMIPVGGRLLENRGGGAPDGARAAAARPGLPPRTVGLRTLGGDFVFDPVGLRIEAGERVVWLNVGDFHTVSAFHPDNANLLPGEVPLRIPEGAESFHSGMLGLTGGTQFEREFPVEGVYDYFCQPHYSFGMVGRLIVGAPGDGPAVTRPISELNEASREQMPSVSRIMGPAGRTHEWAARLNGLLYLRANGEPTDGAVEAIRAGIAEDQTLSSLLVDAGASGEFDAAIEEALADAGGIGYEDLVGRLDAAKTVLKRAAEAT